MTRISLPEVPMKSPAVADPSPFQTLHYFNDVGKL